MSAISSLSFSCGRTDSSTGFCWCDASPAIRNSLFLWIQPLNPRPLSLHLPLPTPPPSFHLPFPSPSRDSKGCYLTRSMTLSRGASLTVSSLIAKIWSPGRSLPKEGPSADQMGHIKSDTCSETEGFTWAVAWFSSSGMYLYLAAHTH